MSNLFKDKREFNDDISQWDVGNADNMSYMFNGAVALDQQPAWVFRGKAHYRLQSASFSSFLPDRQSKWGAFDNTTLRTAVAEWCENQAKAGKK